MSYYQAQFKSVSHRKYLTSFGDLKTVLGLFHNVASEEETFNLRKLSENRFLIASFNGLPIGLDAESEEKRIGGTKEPDAFEIIMKPNSSRVRIKASNGFFLQVSMDCYLTADFQGSTLWEDFDYSVFDITIIGAIESKNKGMAPSITNILSNTRPLDGIRARFQSVLLKKYMCAENGGGTIVVANSSDASYHETFQLWRIPGTSKFLFQVFAEQFMGLDNQGSGVSVVAMSNSPGRLEALEIVQMDRNLNHFRIKAPNGLFLQAKTEELLTADYTEASSQGDADPSIFRLNIIAAAIPDSAIIKAIEVVGQKLRIYESTSQSPSRNPAPSTNESITCLPNREFLDGTRVQFKSVRQGKYISAKKGGGAIVVNQTSAMHWETFKLRRITETGFKIQAFKERFIGLDEQGKGINVVANSDTPGRCEVFEIVRNPSDPSNVRIKASNGFFLQVKNEGSVTADFPSNNQWGVHDPSVFLMAIVRPMDWDNLLSKGDKTTKDTSLVSSIKAVNLGGWLVTDGWIKPSLFDDIPNNDLLDGTIVQFKSVSTNKYLRAQRGGGTNIIADVSEPKDYEKFKLWRISERDFQFRVSRGQFMGLDMQENSTNIVASSTTPGRWETFEIVRNTKNPMRVRIKAPNGLFLQAKDASVTADFSRNMSWGDDNPSVFLMTIFSCLRGEFQAANGYGTEKASKVMREHWKSFIQEKDFKFISQNGLNGVRIPVGWWIASDPNPPWPFVGGSLQALDYVFGWAEKYDLKVIISLHAAPGSQNGWDLSGSRDGNQEWGISNESIDQTVMVIDFLADRYASSPSLIAMELLDSPLAHGVSLKTLKKYYKAGYDAVRKHTSSTYVIMPNRLYADSKELLEFASSLQGSVIDVHYYDFFSDATNTGLLAELSALTIPDGPLIFIGQWTAKLQAAGTKKEDYQRFSRAKLEVLGLTTFGWAYWTLKSAQNDCNLEWMIKNSYISF